MSRSHAPASAIFLAAAAFLGRPAQAFPIEHFPPPILEQLNHCWEHGPINRAEYEEQTTAMFDLLAAGAPHIAVRACRDDYRRGRNDHFHLRIPQARSNGLCRLREQEVFPAADRDVMELGPDGGPTLRLRGWRATAPANWRDEGYRARTQDLVLTADGACPPPSDTGYIRLSNATDEDVLKLLRFWKAATVSPAAFHGALDHTAFNPGIYMRWQRTGSVKLLDELYQRVSVGKSAPSAVRCEAESCRLDVGISNWFIDFRMTADGVIPYRHGGYLTG